MLRLYADEGTGMVTTSLCNGLLLATSFTSAVTPRSYSLRDAKMWYSTHGLWHSHSKT